MNKLLPSILFLFIHITLPAQTDASTGETTPETLHTFLSNDQMIMVMDTGFINEDTIPDLVLIAVSKYEYDEDSIHNNEHPRILIVLLGTGNNRYQNFAQSDKIVLCQTCGGVFGDPFSGLEIRDHGFELSFYGGSRYKWTRNVFFQYDATSEQLVLRKDQGTNFDSLEPETTEQEVNYIQSNETMTTLGKYNINQNW